MKFNEFNKVTKTFRNFLILEDATLNRRVESMNTKTPHIKTQLPGPRATELIARDKNAISPSFVRWYPLVAETGEGTTVIDVDGNNYIHIEYGF